MEPDDSRPSDRVAGGPRDAGSDGSAAGGSDRPPTGGTATAGTATAGTAAEGSAVAAPAGLTGGPVEGGLVVAVDGPGGSGKSTVARELARRLGLRYLDTGAMYRAVTQAVLEARIDLEDVAAISELAERVVLTVGTFPDHPSIAVDEVNVADAIRTRAVTNAVSAVAAVPVVRRRLVAQQQRIIESARHRGGGIVVEGRDIGAVVAPDAQVKVFLTASTQVRALRRSQQLGEKGVDDVARTLAELDRRDALDSRRTADPLAVAPDATVLDSTGLAADEVVVEILRLCQQALAGTR